MGDERLHVDLAAGHHGDGGGVAVGVSENPSNVNLQETFIYVADIFPIFQAMESIVKQLSAAQF